MKIHCEESVILYNATGNTHWDGEPRLKQEDYYRESLRKENYWYEPWYSLARPNDNKLAGSFIYK